MRIRTGFEARIARANLGGASRPLLGGERCSCWRRVTARQLAEPQGWTVRLGLPTGRRSTDRKIEEDRRPRPRRRRRPVHTIRFMGDRRPLAVGGGCAATGGGRSPPASRRRRARRPVTRSSRPRGAIGGSSGRSRPRCRRHRPARLKRAAEGGRGRREGQLGHEVALVVADSGWVAGSSRARRRRRSRRPASPGSPVQLERLLVLDRGTGGRRGQVEAGVGALVAAADGQRGADPPYAGPPRWC